MNPIKPLRRLGTNQAQSTDYPVGTSSPPNMSRPKFSIGVTTYNRPGLLKQCLGTILAQEFQDFEVIVGNDYVSQPLTAETLGLGDPRIRLVNYEQNLGELGNLNALLSMARGEYFTWLADDDYYDPGFLFDVRNALLADGDLPVIYTAYHVVRSYSTSPRAVRQSTKSAAVRLLTGREFLRDYWRNSVKVIGLMGVYRTDYIRSIGGAANLANSRIAIMSEWFLLIQSGLLERVGYLERPLFYFRAHPDSWSATSADGAGYSIAGINILRRSIPIFQDPRLKDDFESNLSGLLKLILLAVAKFGARKNGGFSVRQMLKYFSLLKLECRKLAIESCQPHVKTSLRNAGMYLYRLMPSIMLVSILPPKMLYLIQRIRGRFSGEISDES